MFSIYIKSFKQGTEQVKTRSQVLSSDQFAENEKLVEFNELPQDVAAPTFQTIDTTATSLSSLNQRQTQHFRQNNT